MFIPRYVLCVMGHMSCVTCHVLPVTCHLSHVIFLFVYPLKNWTKWWSWTVEGLLSTVPTPSSFFNNSNGRCYEGLLLIYDTRGASMKAVPPVTDLLVPCSGWPYTPPLPDQPQPPASHWIIIMFNKHTCTHLFCHNFW